MGKSEDIAIERDQQESTLTQEQEIDLYIGVFFDGTNNNKIQVALGKRYRRDEILKEIIRKLNKGEYSREQEEFLIEKNIIGSRKIMVKRPGAHGDVPV